MQTNITNLVEVINNQTTTTSLKIAEYFGKLHKHILEKIKDLQCSEEFTRTNFRPSEYIDNSGKSNLMYQITKDGFVFLTMGFTGTKAAKFKEDYINEFNRMEAQLKSQTIVPTDIRQVTRALLQELENMDIVLQQKTTQNNELQQLLEFQAPVVSFVKETFVNSTGLSDMKTVAHECNIEIKQFYKILRDNDVWFYKLNEFGKSENTVMAKYIASGDFVIKQFFSKNKGRSFDKIFATPKGKLLCFKLLHCAEMLKGKEAQRQLR